MSGIDFIRTYRACDPGEKLRRLKKSYSLENLSIEDLEMRSLEAWEEWDEYDRKGYNPDPGGVIEPERSIWLITLN